MIFWVNKINKITIQILLSNVSQVHNFNPELSNFYHITLRFLKFPLRRFPRSIRSLKSASIWLEYHSFGSYPDSVHFTFKAASGYRWKKKVISGVGHASRSLDVQIESYAFSRARDVVRERRCGHARNTCRLIRKAVHLANNERRYCVSRRFSLRWHTLNCQRLWGTVFHPLTKRSFEFSLNDGYGTTVYFKYEVSFRIG